MIHREISRVFVLHPLATTRCEKHCSAQLCLDNAFALIEGHPEPEQETTNADSGFLQGYEEAGDFDAVFGAQ